jgi:cell division septum initiation protein DivIVA
VSEERSPFARRIDERKFNLSRRGYDKREVRDYLEDLEQAFRELEGHARRTSQRVADLERDVSEARASEKVSVDNAMMAVFDAKDRILERARRKADEIEEAAYSDASRIKAAAIAEVGGSAGTGAGGMAAATAQAEQMIESARREAERIRREATGEASRDLGAEVEAVSAQLRIAHSDTAAAKGELDAARRRIVQLESGLDGAPSAELEERFGQLEAHLKAARDGGARLEAELATRDRQVEALEEAVAAAEAALDESKNYVTRVEADTAERDRTIARLGEEVARLQAERDAQPEPAASDDLGAWMRTAEMALEGVHDYEEQTQLVAELMKVNAAPIGDDARVDELQAAVVAGEERLAGAQHMIAELEAKLAAAPPGDVVGRLAEAHHTIEALEAKVAGSSQPDSPEVESILAAAWEEADAIKAEAEEEAEQRAARVISKAREEADQVRQTVATLTAQAEDARSAALRSKLEAENLAEAQRSMREAGEDIAASARSHAAEIEQEAARAAEAVRNRADETLEKAKAEVARMGAEAEERAAALIAEAERKATAITADAGFKQPEPDDPGDELAEMLAAAEQELAISEELRRQRADLDLREQELAERERALAARRNEEMQQTTQPEPMSVPSPEVLPVDEPARGTIEDDEDADDEDPADRLSALLEAAAPGLLGDTAPPEPGDPVVPRDATRFAASVDLGTVAAESSEPRSRMAWPTPSRVVDAEPRHDSEDEGEDPDDGKRESRYRSRSAQLPRLGSEANESNMTTMANLRNKSRGSNG